MEIMVEIVASTVEGILVGAIVAIVFPVQPISLTDALGRLEALVRDVARAEASIGPIEVSVAVLREVIADSSTCLCKVLRLSCRAICSNLDNITPFVCPLFTLPELVMLVPLSFSLTSTFLFGAAPFPLIFAKGAVTALALVRL